MIDRSQDDHALAAGGVPREAEIEQRLGRHAIGLLQAARDAGDPALIAHAEAMAMAVGYVLAGRLSDAGAGND